MKKQGFTLIELMSVIVLLGLIVALVFPNVVDVVQKKQKEISESKLKVIYSGAKNYCIKNDQSFPCKVELETLDNENEIPFEIDDYKENGSYGDYTCIVVEKTNNNKYSYNHKSNC